MDVASSSRASQESSNEHQLQKSMGKIRKFVSQIKKSVEFSERVLSECRNKFDEIDSQISDVVSVPIFFSDQLDALRDDTPDNSMTDDVNAKMQNSLERIKKNALQVEKSVEFSKGVLSECSDKFQDLDSQMEEISAATSFILQNSTCPLEGSSENSSGELAIEMQTVLQKLTEKIHRTLQQVQKNVDFSKEILSECHDKFEDLDYAITDLKCNVDPLFSDARRSVKRKTQDTEDETPRPVGVFQRRDVINEEKSPSESPVLLSELHNVENTSSNREPPEKRAKENLRKIDAGMEGTYSEPALTAFRRTKGVLTSNDFQTFLYLSGQVEDPVQLAKTSFTRDVEKLYFQLLSFHLDLKEINDSVREHLADRSLEEKVQILIQVFRAEEEISREGVARNAQANPLVSAFLQHRMRAGQQFRLANLFNRMHRKR